jgi:hypothetical protein
LPGARTKLFGDQYEKAARELEGKQISVKVQPRHKQRQEKTVTM